MADFPYVPLGDLALDAPGAIAIGPFGSRMKSDVYVEEGIPVIRGSNISVDKALKGDWVFVSPEFADGIANCVVAPGDLVFPHRGSIGEVALIEPDHGRMVLSTSMMKFRPDPARADGEYLYYYFRSTAGRAEIMRFASQVGTPGIGQPLSSLRQFRVPLPPLCTQRSIAHFLRVLDDKIELNRRMNETLERMAQAIFRDWFVDFGPVRRKMEGASDPVKIMGGVTTNADEAARLAALFPAALADDGLPEGWEDAALSDFVELNPKEPLKKGTVAPYTDMAALPTSGPTTAPPVSREFNSGMRFRNGDALLARITPCLENGKSAYVDFLPDDESVGWGSTEFIVLRSKPPVPSPFAYLMVRHPEFRERAVQSMTGTSGRQRAQANALARFPIARAKPNIYASFGEIIQPMFDLVSAHAKESRTLAAMRDLLLPKLMSGEIRLKDTKKIAEAAE